MQPDRYAVQPGGAAAYHQHTGQNRTAGQPQSMGSYTPRNAYQQSNQAQQNNQAFSRGYTPIRPAGGSGMGGSMPPKKKSGISLLLAVAVIAVIAVIAVQGVQMINQAQVVQYVNEYEDVFCPGVYVDGIHLGGMTPQEGYDAVAQAAQQRDNAWSVTLTYQGDVVTTLTAPQLGMVTDVSQALGEAWAQGHTGDAQTRKNAIDQLAVNPYYGYTVTPGGNTTIVDNVLNTIAGYVYVEPRDAYLVAFDPNLTYPFVIQDEVIGRALPIDDIKNQIYSMVANRQSGVIEIVPQTIMPQVTRAMLEEKYVLRASASTKISTTSTEERNNNIFRSFEKMTGYVLQPGETFSFNKVVGKRTIENGFHYAIEYAYGEKRMGIGGGICQASSTLYMAVVRAGLEIVHREPHSDAVNYTDYGKDATVYWENGRVIDFSFRNNTDEPIYIKARIESDPKNRKRLVASVYIYGAGMGDGVRYELETRTIQELDPPAEPEYKKDTDHTYVTYTDEEYKFSKAEKGYVVESYRVCYVNDVEVERVLLYTDTYKAKAAIVYVGTKKR